MIVLLIPMGIGDLLMTVPTIRRLIAAHGIENVLVVVTSKIHAQIATAFFGNQLKTLVRYDGRRFPNLRLLFKLFTRRPSVVYAPLLSKRPLHFVFMLLVGARSLVQETFCRTSFAWIRRVPMSQATFSGHQADYTLQFIATDDPTIDATPIHPNEMLATPDTTVIPPIPGHPLRVAIGLSCNPIERHKIPPPPFFSEALTALAAKLPITVILIGSAADGPIHAQFRSNINNAFPIEELIDKPFGELVKALQTCHLGICGTTGHGHMMAAANLPLVVLAGVTDAAESGPLAQRAAILRHNLPCAPCYQETFRRGCGVIPCMSALQPEIAANLAWNMALDPLFGEGWQQTHRRRQPVPPSEIDRIVSQLHRDDSWKLRINRDMQAG